MADILQIGLGIDPSAAVAGGAEVEAALGRIETSAERVGAAIDSKAGASVGALQEKFAELGAVDLGQTLDGLDKVSGAAEITGQEFIKLLQRIDKARLAVEFGFMTPTGQKNVETVSQVVKGLNDALARNVNAFNTGSITAKEYGSTINTIRTVVAELLLTHSGAGEATNEFAEGLSTVKVETRSLAPALTGATRGLLATASAIGGARKGALGLSRVMSVLQRSLIPLGVAGGVGFAVTLGITAMSRVLGHFLNKGKEARLETEKLIEKLLDLAAVRADPAAFERETLGRTQEFLEQQRQELDKARALLVGGLLERPLPSSTGGFAGIDIGAVVIAGQIEELEEGLKDIEKAAGEAAKAIDEVIAGTPAFRARTTVEEKIRALRVETEALLQTERDAAITRFIASKAFLDLPADQTADDFYLIQADALAAFTLELERNIAARKTVRAIAEEDKAVVLRQRQIDEYLKSLQEEVEMLGTTRQAQGRLLISDLDIIGTEAEKIDLLNELLDLREVNRESLEESRVATELANTADDARVQSIQDIIGALSEEIAIYDLSNLELDLRIARSKDAKEADLDLIRAQHGLLEIMDARAKADKEEEKQAKEVEKAWERAMENIQDATADFLIAIGDGLEGLEDLAKRVLRILQEVAAQIAATAAIRFIVGLAGSGGGATDTSSPPGVGVKGTFGGGTSVTGDIADLDLDTFRPTIRPVEASAPAMQFTQHVTIEAQMLDGRGVTDLLREQKPVIASLMAEAVQESGAFAAQLRR